MLVCSGGAHCHGVERARFVDTFVLQASRSLLAVLAVLAVGVTFAAAGQQQYPLRPLQHPGEAELILPEETQQVAVVAAHDLHAAATGEFTNNFTVHYIIIVLFPRTTVHLRGAPHIGALMGLAEHDLAGGYCQSCLKGCINSTCLGTRDIFLFSRVRLVREARRRS